MTLPSSPRGGPGEASGGEGPASILGTVLWIAAWVVAAFFFPALPALVLLWKRRRVLMPAGKGPSGLLPPGDPTRGFMSNTPIQQALRVQGVISAVNRGGVKIDGRWHNYPRGYAGERLPREAIGSYAVLLIVVYDDKPYIDSVLKLEKVPSADAFASPAEASAQRPVESPAPSAPVPAPEPDPSIAPVATATEAPTAPESAPEAKRWASEPSTDAQRLKIERLAEAAGMTIQSVLTIARLAFRNPEKSMGNLTKGEASKLIVLLDGDAPTLPPRRRS